MVLIWRKHISLKIFFGEKIESESSQQKNFLWAVRPIKLKNGRRLYRAFSEARKHFPEIELDDGRYPHEELLRRVSSCYAVILPSISEVSPNLILDAIRYNKPFILTRETGYFEKLKEIGLFVNPLDERDIADKIIFLSNGINYRNIQRKIEDFDFTHSYKNIASEFLTIFSKL